MKIQERVILICFLAGIGLGVVGILLKVTPPHHGTVSACTFKDSSASPDCGTPYHVVQYTVETQPQVNSVRVGVQDLDVEIEPAAPSPLPAIPATLAYDRLSQTASRLTTPEQPLLTLLKTTSMIPLRPTLPGRDSVSQGNTARDRLWIRPDGAVTRLIERAVITGAVLALFWSGEGISDFRQSIKISETLTISWRSLVQATRPTGACPTTSPARFELIPIDGPAADHPDLLHGDLSLRLRGYQTAPELLALVDYNGPADPDAPQLAGLFAANRMATLSAAYRVNHWQWDTNLCGGQTNGCPGEAIGDWPVTLVGLATTAGEVVYVPERGAEIYSGGYVALVLYAEEKRITLGYTRRDSVAAGYVVHLEQVCVDPNLVALYRAQNNVAGWRSSGRLPALRNNQALGTALGSEILVAVRDNGNFLDPRSRKDWWQR